MPIRGETTVTASFEGTSGVNAQTRDHCGIVIGSRMTFSRPLSLRTIKVLVAHAIVRD